MENFLNESIECVTPARQSDVGKLLLHAAWRRKKGKELYL
jgi:hypothetical protein